MSLLSSSTILSGQFSLSDARDSVTTRSTTPSTASTYVGDVDVYDIASEHTNEAVPVPADRTDDKDQMVVKIGIVGDQGVGKSSFMRRYVCQSFQPSSYGYYNNSPGSVLFLEKQISMSQVNLFLGLWCSTTYSTYESALQLVCKDANVIIFMFSLTNRQSLVAIKEWHERAQIHNPDSIPILVGTQYDKIQDNISSDNPLSHQYLNEYHRTTKLARKYAMKMRASLIYISSKMDININHVIKACVAKVFNIRPKLREYHWNTLKALREHNIYKLLKTWSNKSKMNHLMCGYLKRHQLMTETIHPKVLDALTSYIQYDLLPNHHHHSRDTEGRKRSKSSKKSKSHRKKSSRITKSDKKSRRKSKGTQKKSTKSHRKSTKKRRKSSRGGKYKAMPESPVAIPSSLFTPGASIVEYEGYDMVVEGAIKLQ